MCSDELSFFSKTPIYTEFAESARHFSRLFLYVLSLAKNA